jgi:hypothetical protein
MNGVCMHSLCGKKRGLYLITAQSLQHFTPRVISRCTKLYQLWAVQLDFH